MTRFASHDAARPTGGHVFVDETKGRDYIVAAATVLPGDVVQARKRLRALLLPGQKRMHFVSEKDSRRRQILATMSELGAQVTLYIAPTKKAHVGRTACLDAVLDDVIKHRAARLVLELDETVRRYDLAQISDRLYPLADKPVYQHATSSAEPLLWISDAVGWCYHRGSEWRAACAPLVIEHRRLQL